MSREPGRSLHSEPTRRRRPCPGALVVGRVRGGTLPGKARHNRLCWVSQKRAEKRPCIERLKGEEIAYIPLVILTRKALEINHRDLTNRVTTSFTPVRTEADLIPQAVVW